MTTKKAKIKQFNVIKVNTRRFILNRVKDVTGNSGTGAVAVGVQFPNGRVAMTWLSHMGTQVWYDSIEIVKALHGHDGDTEVVWFDKEENKEVTLDDTPS
jgi:hypothetical protein